MVTNISEVILTRLAQLEAEQTIRQIMSEYMHLCDDLSYHEVPGKIAELFTEDAIWEGVGDLYKNKLGHYRNRNAIKKMMEGYVKAPPHFSINVHFLCSEYIKIKQPSSAQGRWKMLQSSTFSSGESHINCAELDVEFSLIDSKWLISRFTTRNIFSRPVDHLNSYKELPVPEIEKP